MLINQSLNDPSLILSINNKLFELLSSITRTLHPVINVNEDGKITVKEFIEISKKIESDNIKKSKESKKKKLKTAKNTAVAAGLVAAAAATFIVPVAVPALLTATAALSRARKKNITSFSEGDTTINLIPILHSNVIPRDGDNYAKDRNSIIEYVKSKKIFEFNKAIPIAKLSIIIGLDDMSKNKIWRQYILFCVKINPQISDALRALEQQSNDIINPIGLLHLINIFYHVLEDDKQSNTFAEYIYNISNLIIEHGYTRELVNSVDGDSFVDSIVNS